MRALLSVANRDGIAALARDLRALDVELFATDGTREYLAAEGVEAASVSDLTSGEPTVGGQVKTFHHAVYAGILARRDVPEGLDSEILHVYDLALPADFTPRNTDGEVSEFLSLDAAALLERIAGGEMTVEAGLVAVDFALRNGLVQDESGKLSALVEACRDPTAI